MGKELRLRRDVTCELVDGDLVLQTGDTGEISSMVIDARDVPKLAELLIPGLLAAVEAVIENWDQFDGHVRLPVANALREAVKKARRV